MASIAELLQGTLGVAAQIAITVGILVIVLVIGILVVYFASFKHTVVARYLTTGEAGQKRGKFVKRYKAKTRIKKGVHQWILQLRPFKHKEMTAPPPEAVHITGGGKLFAECYISEDDPEPRWLKDTMQVRDSFQPFTTQERALHVDGVTRDLIRKKKNPLDVLLQMAPLIAIVIMVLAFFIFFENIAKPAQDMMKENVKLMNQNAVISEQNAKMLQVITGKISIDELQVQQEFKAPPDAGEEDV